MWTMTSYNNILKTAACNGGSSSSSTTNPTSSSKQDLESTAGLSSAAACIHFHYSIDYHSTSCLTTSNSNTFKPVYTHQIFDSNEVIRGYQPFPEAQQESLDIANKLIEKMNSTRIPSSNDNESTSSSLHTLYYPHSSFQHQYHIHAKSYLDIQIQLAPSCTNCNITLSYRDILKEQSVKKDESSDCTNENQFHQTQEEAGKKRKISTILQEDDSILQIDDIVKLISKGLPTIQNVTTTMKDDSSSLYNNHSTYTHYDNDSFLTSPIGKPLFEYQHQNNTFVLCFANGIDEKVADYHNQVQKLAIWFIENADDVDLTSDEGGGSWKVLYLFHKQQQQQQLQHSKNDVYKYSLVGYVTLFAFYSPFKKPKSGIVLRICQALILPPYQRCGHGKVFIRAVYDYANGKFDDKLLQQSTTTTSSSTLLEVVEVNVEDPAPSFEALRNCVDYELFCENYKTSSSSITGTSTSPTVNDDINDALFLPLKYYKDTCFETIRDNDAVQAASKAKVSKVQVHIAYEIFKLDTVTKVLENINNTTSLSSSDVSNNSEDIEKSYRLMVKKRLNQHHCEEIGACQTKDQKKKKLGVLYEDTVQKYRKILSSLTLHK